MVDQDDQHAVYVAAWLGKAARDLPAVQLVELLERAFKAIWSRAHHTLGEVTLGAITDRVISNAGERFPVARTVRREAADIRFEELRERAADLDREELARVMNFFLVELLTVLGRLTADILTPALHAELSRVAPRGAASPARERARRPPKVRTSRKVKVKKS